VSDIAIPKKKTKVIQKLAFKKTMVTNYMTFKKIKIVANFLITKNCSTSQFVHNPFLPATSKLLFFKMRMEKPAEFH